MAQAVYDDHPLENYLNELGEGSMQMPGGSTDFAPHEDEEIDALHDEDIAGVRQEQSWIVDVFEILSNLLVTSRFSQQPNPFIERFKYDVISSSLLSSSLSATHSRRPSSPSFPGNLRTKSRTPSLELARPPSPSKDSSYTSNAVQTLDPIPRHTPGIFALVAVVFGTGHYLLALLVLVAAFMHVSSDGVTKHDMTPTLHSLEELISASDIWDSVVHDAINILENEEQSVFYGPTTPSSPLSHLRVALNSSLHTTQTQCDHIRQLLSALTSPSELPQLSEMYAPPSPTKLIHDSDPHSPRPLSLSTSHSIPRQRTTSVPSTIGDKRSTWNGSYASLAGAGSPPMHLLRRREKRRSDLTSILQSSMSSKSFSAPPTPLNTNGGLSGVKEETSEEVEDLSSSSYIPFGPAALDLRRKRKSAGMEALGFSSHFGSPRSPPSTIASGSRFTALHTTRHPLSLSSLNLALQGALSSKRYTCSHLLALRFSEEEDDGYWEDVRSVMGLLTSTFADVSARLTEALDETEARRVKDQTPTPEAQSRRTSYQSVDGMRESLSESLSKDLVNKIGQFSGPSTPSASFAPMPSELSRFATHVEAISTALTDAREHLMECVASLRESADDQDKQASIPDEPEGFVGSAALQAYERLRRELGLALRECERGRERLLDIVSPRKQGSDIESDELPALGQDHGSDSDKADSSFPLDDENNAQPINFSIVSPENPEEVASGLPMDDATAHLLLTASSKHLPPIGAEQVFESDSANTPAFTRERSKLSREERIKLTKAKRASAGGKGSFGLGVTFEDQSSPAKGGVEKWGPSGDVVQELKDVIWKVGEKRRKMVAPESTAATTTDPRTGPMPIPTTLPPPADSIQSQERSDFELIFS